MNNKNIIFDPVVPTSQSQSWKSIISETDYKLVHVTETNWLSRNFLGAIWTLEYCALLTKLSTAQKIAKLEHFSLKVGGRRKGNGWIINQNDKVLVPRPFSEEFTLEFYDILGYPGRSKSRYTLGKIFSCPRTRHAFHFPYSNHMPNQQVD